MTIWRHRKDFWKILKFSILTARGLLWAYFTLRINFSWITYSYAFFSYITWALSEILVENGHFEHPDRPMTVTSITIIVFSWNTYFWILQSVRFHMIYNKPYNHQKFQIMISESIGRFFLTRFPSHVTRKPKKEKITECVIQLRIIWA